MSAGHSNNSIQSAIEIAPLGCLYTVKITSPLDLNRQLVKSEHCLVSLPEYALQIPASRGQFTTVEGIIRDTIRDLEGDQPERKLVQPEVWEKIEELLNKLKLLVEGGKAGEGNERKMPAFTIKLDDPSGNSFIEAVDGLGDPKWSKKEYTRSKEQSDQLGINEGQDEEDVEKPEEVLSFPGVCSLCGSVLETLMKTVVIPHFKASPFPSFHCDEPILWIVGLTIYTLLGHHPHVDQLSRLRVQGHGGQEWRSHLASRTQDHAQGRGHGRSQSRHPQGASVPRLTDTGR